MNVFRKFGDRNIVLENIPLVFPVEQAIYFARLAESIEVFPVNYQSENCIADKRRYFLCQYFHSIHFYEFY